MLTIVLPNAVETAVIAAAQRAGLTVDDYLAAVCADALSLEIDRARLDAYLEGTPGVPHERARAWLTDLSAGNRTACPR